MPRSRGGYTRIARTLRIEPPTLSTRFLDAEGLAWSGTIRGTVRTALGQLEGPRTGQPLPSRHRGAAAPRASGLPAHPAPARARLRLPTSCRHRVVICPSPYLRRVISSYFARTSPAYAVRFYTRVLEGYRRERVRFKAVRGPERYQEGLERLEMSRHLASTDVLGQISCIAVKPLG